MMNPVPWLQMTNMISYQGLVRTFLNNGLEALSDNLEILPIAETHVDSQLALIMRQQEPVSTLAEKCFAEAQGIFG